MSLSFPVTAVIPAKAETIYNAWLASREHALMTDSDSARASHKIGAIHKAHGTYITGKNLELIPNQKIVQSWRNSDFKKSDPDSLIEVTLKPKGSKTQVTIVHSGIPEHEFQVEQGWVDYYFVPMKHYFGTKNK